MSRLPRLDGLWRHPDFLKLWAGQTVSLAGSLMGRFAMPLVAISVLDASPGEVALLKMGELLPGVAVGLAAGVLVDRARRRRLMIVTDLGRAALLLTVPLAALLGVLRIEYLLLVVLAAGTLTALFEVAYHAYLPTVISHGQLVEGNSKLQASGAVVEVGAFGLGGVLVQVLTAPFAILLDALSFLVSAACLIAIRAPDTPAHPSEGEEETTLSAIRAGLKLVLHDPVLRALALARGTADLFIFLWASMLIVFITRDLDLEPLVFGMLFAIGGVSSFFGALAAGPVERRLGLGPTLIVTLLLSTASLLTVPLAAGPFLLVVGLVGAQQVVDAAATMFQIHEASLIQASAPAAALGRVTASLRVIGWGAMLAGTVLGGVLGETIGPRATLLVGALGALPAVLWLVCSPVRRLRRLPSG